MPVDEEANEHSRLIEPSPRRLSPGRPIGQRVDELRDATPSSIISSHVTKDEQALAGTAVGERLPYNDYTTIDWLHDLVCSLFKPIGSWLTDSRSKTLSATALYTPSVAPEHASSPRGIRVKAGLLRP